MFSIEMLPAAHGDCLWIEYRVDEGPLGRVLIDGGPSHTYGSLVERIQALPADDRHFELVVVTHIDCDHIDGIIRLLQEEHLGITVGEIWFNGWPQVSPPTQGAKQGEYLAVVIEQFEQRVGEMRWNTSFGRMAVRPGLPESDVVLPGGLEITVLGPPGERLEALHDLWEDVVRDAGWEPGDRAAAGAKLGTIKTLRPLIPEPAAVPEQEPAPADLPEVPTQGGKKPGADTSVANGSSISLLVSLAGQPKALLVGDAFAADIEDAVCKLAGDGADAERFAVDAFKLPHHGSIANLTAGLLSALSCKHYLVSTSGAQFKHPDPAAIDLVLGHHDSTRGAAELHFNYLTETTNAWEGPGALHVSGPLILE